jgi:hypothetical protein
MVVLHPVAVMVASTLNVVEAVSVPVEIEIPLPVPDEAVPILVFVALFRSW